MGVGSEPLGAARHLASFDGLRAIAVTFVMAYHFFYLVPVFPESQSLFVGLQLRVGVWVFFVLSGFLLYRPYAAAHAGVRVAPTLGNYARARFLRIWPAYAVALFILTFVWHRIELNDAPSFFIHLSLVQNYLRSEYAHGIGPTWSLVVEVAFYAFLPLYAGVVARSSASRNVWRAEITGLIGLMGFGVIWQVVAVDHRMWIALVPSFLPTFALGMGLAVAVVHGRSRGLSVLASRAWLCVTAAAALIVGKGLIGGADGFEDGFHAQNQVLYSAIAFLIVLPAVFGIWGGYNRALQSRPFRAVGRVSYGMFLWSVPVIGVAQLEWIPLEPKFHGRSAVVAIVAFATTFVIGSLSWLLVEQPALRLKPRRTTVAARPRHPAPLD